MATSRQGGGPSPKGYNIEKTTVMVKKKKLKLATSYDKPVAGYTFLPIGTPELADRCKELSRKRGLLVYLVHARPNNTNQTDPLKVSHHSNRIGYHFKAEVVDEASRELRYIMYAGRFVKEADHKAQFRQDYIYKVLERHGVHMERTERQETPRAVIDAIRELFPRIPDEDLNEVVDRAWRQGSGRVGNNAELPLARRVSLAVIARIRHVYTDYDGLLRAFGDWKGARREVEYRCLQKLIEWRGENDVVDDNELEAILVDLIDVDRDEDEERHILEGERNIIKGRQQAVIDLTSDDEADDEDSDAALGDTSDASIEHPYQPARAVNLRQENANEISGARSGQHRPLLPPQTIEQRKLVARQVIDEARRSTRQPHPPGPSSNITSVHVSTNGNNDADYLAMGGELYLRENVQPTVARPLLSPPRFPQTMAPRGLDNAAQSHFASAPFGLKPNLGSNNELPVDAVPSIEPHVPVSDPALPSRSPTYRGPPSIDRHVPISDSAIPLRPINHSGPSTAYQDDRLPKRRRMQYSPDHTFLSSDGHRELHPQKQRGLGEVRMNDRPPNTHQPVQIKPDPVPYDPTQPMLDFPVRDTRNEMRMLNRESPRDPHHPVFYASQSRSERIPPYESSFRPQGTTQLFSGGAYPPSNHQAPPHRLIPASSLTPQPVHGAPAPVQQVPLAAGSMRGVPAPPNTQPFHASTNSPQRPSVPPPLPPGWTQVPQPPPGWQLNGAQHPAPYFAPR